MIIQEAMVTLGLLINSVYSIPTDYWRTRMQLLRLEEIESFGGDIALDVAERTANNYLMLAKNSEINSAMNNSNEFLPSKNFLKVDHLIEESEVFKIIKEMPKGSILHVHDSAFSSREFVFNATFHKNVYICDEEKIKLRFFDNPNSECDWKLLEDIRKNDTQAAAINRRINAALTMGCHKDECYPNGNDAWLKLESIFSLIKPLITYRPVYEDFVYNGLLEAYNDNVMFVELRTGFPKLYELDGTKLTRLDQIRIFKNVLCRFIKKHPDFIGAKFIYAGRKSSDLITFEEYKTTLSRARAAYPDMIAGFDLVGQEDKSHSLAYFVDEIMKLDPTINLFFHAGETNWFGSPMDENLIDAVLLGAKRIGHGYALLKHPKVMKKMRMKDIAIEVNPISNQVLGLVRDMRNHPASELFAQNYPVVISNDDPFMLGTKALSYDFYEAFMGIMSARSDLRALKKLALNSIEYSSMDAEQMARANKLFREKWDLFVRKINIKSQQKISCS